MAALSRFTPTSTPSSASTKPDAKGGSGMTQFGRALAELNIEILCAREQRHVGQQLTLAYDRSQIILERSDLADKLAGQYVEIYDFADRPLEVRWKGYSLPYRVFSKDQRVSHTAIVENKRLSHALATVKAQQDIKHMPKVMTNSAKDGYKKRPRHLYGPDYKAPIEAPPAGEMTA